MDKLKKLLEQRANVWSQYQEVLARATDDGFSAEDRATLDTMDDEIRSLSEDIERLERASALDKRFEEINRSAVPEEPAGSDAGESRDRGYSEAFVGFLRNGMDGLEAEQRQILRQGFVASSELRAQGVATGAAGGFLVPEEFRRKIIEAMKFYGSVQSVAEVIETTTGADLPWPTNDDTANKGALLAENTAVTEQDLVIGEDTLKAHMYTSKLVRVSFQLLQDEAFGLEDFIERKLGERVGRIWNEHFTTGTGTNQPEGVQTNAVNGKTGAAGQTTSIVYDDLIDLEHSVDVAYRNERSRFMLHDLSLAKIRKLKDADNRPLWQPSLMAGAPSTINGREYVVNNDMPQMAANVKSVLFGDFFAGYVVRLVKEFLLLRLTERYAEFLQVGFLGFARADGQQQDAAAYKAYVNAAT